MQIALLPNLPRTLIFLRTAVTQKTRPRTRGKTMKTNFRGTVCSLIVMSVSVGAFCVTSRAATITPDIQLDQSVNTDIADDEYHGSYADSPTNGVISSASTEGSMTVTASISPEPVVTVSSDLTAGEFMGASYLSYSCQVLGPDGPSVPINLTGTVSVASANGRNINQIVVDVNGVGLDATTLGGGVLQLEGVSADVNGSCAFTVSTSVAPNTVFAVDVWAANIAFGPDSAQSGVAHDTLQIDPILEFDPSFADAASYSFQLSPGVGNSIAVPEPGSLAPLGIGFVGLMLGLATNRRRRYSA
jgi:hypothetical protein